MEVEQLFSEIRQIIEQYKAEVHGRRRAWPKSVRDRVVSLSRLGMKNQVIAKETGLSMNTVYSWLTRSELNTSVKVAASAPSPSFIPVTVKRPVEPAKIQCAETRANLTVTVVINSRIRIEGYPVDQIFRLLGQSAGDA